MERRISDLMDGFMEDSVELAPAPEVSLAAIKEATMAKIKKESKRGGSRRTRKLLRTVLLAAVLTALLAGGTALAVTFSGIRSVEEDLALEVEPSSSVANELADRAEIQAARLEQQEARLSTAEQQKEATSKEETLEGELILFPGYFFFNEAGHVDRIPALAQVGDRVFRLASKSRLSSTMVDGKPNTVFTTVEGAVITVKGGVTANLSENDVTTLSEDGMYTAGPYSTPHQLDEESTLTWYVSSVYELGSYYRRGQSGLGSGVTEDDYGDVTWSLWKNEPNYGDFLGYDAASPRAYLSVSGLKDNPEAKAFMEWTAYLEEMKNRESSSEYWMNKIDWDSFNWDRAEYGTRIMENLNSEDQEYYRRAMELSAAEEQFRAAHPEYNHYLGVDSQEKADKLEEILTNYGLKKLSGFTECDDYESLWKNIGLSAFIDNPDETIYTVEYTFMGQVSHYTHYPKGYCYADGTFNIEGCLYHPNFDRGFGWDIRRTMKGSFTDVLSISRTDWLEEWDYEAKDGTPIHICVNAVNAMVYADLPTSFVTIGIGRGLDDIPEYGIVGLTQADLEAFCDAIHWDVLG